MKHAFLVGLTVGVSVTLVLAGIVALVTSTTPAQASCADFTTADNVTVVLTFPSVSPWDFLPNNTTATSCSVTFFLEEPNCFGSELPFGIDHVSGQVIQSAPYRSEPSPVGNASITERYTAPCYNETLDVNFPQGDGIYEYADLAHLEDVGHLTITLPKQ
jgi:hypothetical protein